uniref:hypothetical protein n=1 Tax=Parablautia intestinalis TaxID=2320100 RepID=UPI0024127829|nr:hypothetical protein [Parablautia intestinalis]
MYNAPNETSALSELEKIKEKWGRKSPYSISNWENNWEDVSSFFQPLLILSALAVLPEFSLLILGAECGQSP